MMVVRRTRNNRRGYNFVERMSLTNLLIAINVAVFIAFILISGLAIYFYGMKGSELMIKFIALRPSLVLEGYIWTFITSMFMHGNFTHLFVNMVSMFFIGNFVERLIGRKRFFWFYMISGILAGLFFVGFAYLGLYVPRGEALFGGIDTFAVGASGALFGLGGLLAVLIPKLRVLVFFVIPMPMWAAMAVLMFGLWIFSFAGGLPVGNTAHFGGLVAGLVYGFYLRKKYARKVKMLNRMFR